MFSMNKNPEFCEVSDHTSSSFMSCYLLISRCLVVFRSEGYFSENHCRRGCKVVNPQSDLHI